MTIRLATTNDVDVLRELSITTFTQTFGHLYEPHDLSAYLARAYSTDALGALLAHPAYRVWLLNEPQPVGYVLASTACGLPHDEVTNADGEIKRLYLLRGFQGGGRGQELMRTALEWLETDGPRTIWLGVWSENYGAQRFYQRFGFSQAGEYGFVVGDHVDHEFIYRRPARTQR